MRLSHAFWRGIASKSGVAWSRPISREGDHPTCTSEARKVGDTLEIARRAALTTRGAEPLNLKKSSVELGLARGGVVRDDFGGAASSVKRKSSGRAVRAK